MTHDIFNPVAEHAEAVNACERCQAKMASMPESLLIEGEGKDAIPYDQEMEKHALCEKCQMEASKEKSDEKEEAKAQVSRHQNRFTFPFNVFGPSLSMKNFTW